MRVLYLVAQRTTTINLHAKEQQFQVSQAPKRPGRDDTGAAFAHQRQAYQSPAGAVPPGQSGLELLQRNQSADIGA